RQLRSSCQPPPPAPEAAWRTVPKEGITRQGPAVADRGAVIHRAAIRGNSGTGRFGTVCNTRQWQARDTKMLPYPTAERSGILRNTRQSPAAEGNGGSRAMPRLAAPD